MSSVSNKENEYGCELIFKNHNFEIWFQDGIFNIKILQNIFDLEMAKECVRLRIKFTAPNSYPMISDSRCVKDFIKEAREYLADEKNTQYLSAGAILVQNRSQRIIGNFFLQINKPSIPSKIFVDRMEALKWLESYKDLGKGPLEIF